MRLLGSFLLLFSFSVHSYERIISTIPSITESIYFLGGGKKLVGASPYCLYPEKAKSLPRVGTGLTPKYEKILSLKPDLLLMSEINNGKIASHLKKMEIPFKTLGFNSLNEIFGSFKQIGTLLGEEKKADYFLKDIEKALSPLKTKKSFLWIIGSEGSNGLIAKVMIAGKGTHFDDILKRLGQKSAARKLTGYKYLSLEKLMGLNPDIIFTSFPSTVKKNVLQEQKKLWSNTKMLKAVKNKKVFFLYGDQYVIPGPRIKELINDTREALLEP